MAKRTIGTDRLIDGVKIDNLPNDTNAELAGKQDTLGYNPLQSIQAGTNITIDNTDPLNPVINGTGGSGSGDVTASGTLTNDTIILGGGNKVVKTSGKTITTTLGSDDTTLPTSKAVKDVTDTKVTGNVAITGATKTKITYDSKGLVTAGADADYTDIVYPTTYKIGNPTHIDTLQEIFNHEFSSGVMHGCDITNNGDGTVSFATGVAMLRSSADAHTPLYSIEVSAQSNLALTDNATNYIYLDYNAGTPQFVASTSITSFNCLDKCIAYLVYRNGTTLDIIDAREQNVDGNRKSRKLFLDFSRFIHTAGGSVLGTPSGLYISLTAGSFYFMLQKLDHDAFDTSVAGTNYKNVFTLWYRDGVGGWTSTADQKTITTTTYDNSTGTPATLGNNKYGVTWFYLVNNSPSKLHAVMGQAEYADLASARVASLPSSVPGIIEGLGSLVGFVIYQKSAVSYADIRSAFTQTFTSTSPTIHNGLSGLQGGTTNEYYHLTNAEYTNLVTTDNSKTLTNKTFDDEFRAKQIATPSNPSSGYNKLYFKNDDKLYKLTSLGTETEIGSSGGGGFWTLMPGTPTRTSNTTFTVTGDVTAYVAKGMVIKWTESGNIRCGMVSIPSTYSSPNTTITIIGDTMASIDASSLKYGMVGVEGFIAKFAIAGSIGTTGTDVANAYYATEPMRVIGADLQVGTVASTSGTTTIDINKNGTTFMSTKATLAYNVASSPLPFTADTATSLALGDKITIDIDGVTSTTFPTDLYIQTYLFPTRLLLLP